MAVAVFLIATANNNFTFMNMLFSVNGVVKHKRIVTKLNSVATLSLFIMLHVPCPRSNGDSNYITL